MDKDQQTVWDKLNQEYPGTEQNRSEKILKEYRAILFDIELANSLSVDVTDVIKNRHDCGMNFLK